MKLAVISILLFICSFRHPLQNASQRVDIYSGSCTFYKKEWAASNKVRFRKLSQAFGKLVVDRTNKRLNFYYNGKLVFSRDSFDSYIDTQQGGEGFTSYNGVDAHRYTAERMLEINVSDAFKDNDLGYQYEINNYKVN